MFSRISSYYHSSSVNPTSMKKEEALTNYVTKLIYNHASASQIPSELNLWVIKDNQLEKNMKSFKELLNSPSTDQESLEAIRTAITELTSEGNSYSNSSNIEEGNISITPDSIINSANKFLAELQEKFPESKLGFQLNANTSNLTENNTKLEAASTSTRDIEIDVELEKLVKDAKSSGITNTTIDNILKKGNIAKGIFGKKNNPISNYGVANFIAESLPGTNLHKVYTDEQKQFLFKIIKHLNESNNIAPDIKAVMSTQYTNFISHNDFSFFNENIEKSKEMFEKNNLNEMFAPAKCFTIVNLDSNKKLDENPIYQQIKGNLDNNNCKINDGITETMTEKITASAFNAQVLYNMTQCLQYLASADALKQDEINIKLAGPFTGGSIAAATYSNIQNLLAGKFADFKKEYGVDQEVANDLINLAPTLVELLKDKKINYQLGLFNPSNGGVQSKLKLTNLPEPFGKGEVWLEMYIVNGTPEKSDISHITVANAKRMYVKPIFVDATRENIMNINSTHAETVKEFFGLNNVISSHVTITNILKDRVNKEDIEKKSNPTQLDSIINIYTKLDANDAARIEKESFKKANNVIFSSKYFKNSLNKLAALNLKLQHQIPFADETEFDNAKSTLEEVFNKYLITSSNKLENLIIECIKESAKYSDEQQMFFPIENAKAALMVKNLVSKLKDEKLREKFNQQIDFKLEATFDPYKSYSAINDAIKLDKNIFNGLNQALAGQKSLREGDVKNESADANQPNLQQYCMDKFKDGELHHQFFKEFKAEFDRAERIYLKVNNKILDIKEVFNTATISGTNLKQVKNEVKDYFIQNHFNKDIVDDLIRSLVQQGIPNLIDRAFKYTYNGTMLRLPTDNYLYQITYDIKTNDAEEIIVIATLNYSLHNEKTEVECGLLFDKDDLVTIKEAQIYNFNIIGENTITQFSSQTKVGEA